MEIYGGVNPYESHRFGFGTIDTIQQQDAVSTSRNPVLISNDRNPSTQAYQQIMRIREAVQAIKPVMLESGEVEASDVSSAVVESIVEENAEKPWKIQNSEATPVTAADANILGTLVHNMANAMNTLFDDAAFKSSPGAFLEGVRNGIRTAISSAFGSEGPQYNTDFGINFDFSNTDGKVFNFSSADQQRFETTVATRDGAAAVGDTLFGGESNGLFNQLHSTLTASSSAFENQSDPTGLFLDVSI